MPEVKTPLKTLPQRKAEFVRVMGETGNMELACAAAEISRYKIADIRKADKDFDKECDAAMDKAMDLLEAEATRRAKDGTLRPVFQAGMKVGVVREYSDQLLMFLLKGGRPQKFRDNVKMEMDGSLEIKVVNYADRAKAK